MDVPLVDLAWQHRHVQDEIRRGLDEILQSSAFIGGPAVAAFERDFARACDARHCVGLGNGTDALELMLRAVGVGPGDEVIVPALTFVATASAVLRAGARPVLVDVEPDTFLMDPRAAAAALGQNTAALLPVHLYGQMAPMEELARLADRAGLALLEDGAQSQGARHRGQPMGSFGRAAATSFYPSKNLGAFGDGGAVVTGDGELAARLRRLGDHGAERRFQHDELGFNSRLDAIQALVLRAKLHHLDAWNGLRCEAAARYDALLADLPGLVLPTVAEGNEPVWHLYVVRVPRRDGVLRALNDAGVGASVHYPRPVHLQGAFASLQLPEGSFPQAERASREILSLPVFPGIRAEQQAHVAMVLAGCLG